MQIRLVAYPCGHSVDARRTAGPRRAAAYVLRVSAHRPPLPGGPWLVVGLARSGAAAARALWARGEPVIGVDAGEPAEAAGLREEGIEVWTGVDGLGRAAPGAGGRQEPGRAARGAGDRRGARELGLPVLGELELGWRLARAPVRRGHRDQRQDDDGRAARGDLARGGARGRGRRQRRHAPSPRSPAAWRATRPSSARRAASSSRTRSRSRPRSRVLLNLTPDHLDRHGTLEAYRAAKLRVFAHQDAGDVAVLPRERWRGLRRGRARRVIVRRRPGDDLALARRRAGWRGRAADRAAEHPRCAARTTPRTRWPPRPPRWRRGIDRGRGRRGAARRSPASSTGWRTSRTLDGVTWVNDSKATNVASTLVALAAFDAPVHLILGGQAQGPGLRRRCAALVAARGRRRLPDRRGAPELRATTLDGRRADARLRRPRGAPCAAARGGRGPGEVVLLSPACASFDQFRRLRGARSALQGARRRARRLSEGVRRPAPKRA